MTINRPQPQPEQRHYCAVCGENAYVGVGVEPITWLCMDHFQASLKDIRSKLKGAMGNANR